MINIIIEKEIVEGCKQKQQHAQEALYKSCYPAFMKICLRYADYDDAANILHDAFIKILTKIDSYTGEGDIVGWMRRTVVNTCIDFTRTQKRKSDVLMENIPDVMQEEEEKKFVADEHAILKLIRELPEKHGLVFNLFVMDEFTHQQIAEKLKITVASSKWYLFEARKILQEKVSVLKLND